MFKNLNRTYLALCIVLIGTCSHVFAIDLFQAFSQAEEQSVWIDSIFQGKPVVSNLYSKALKLVQNKEINAISSSFDLLISYYSACPHIEKSDFINILYDSNVSFNETFNQILPEWTTTPTAKNTAKSYNKFLNCNSTTSNLSSLTDVKNEINRLFYDEYSNNYSLSSINEDTFWSDLFWNGTLDDSSFDLLYDINQIGKILFDDFTESPQILFYRLPTSPQVSAQNGSDASSLSDQSSYQVGNGWWSWLPNWTSDTPNSSLGSLFFQQDATLKNDIASQPKDDIEIQNFIDRTNSLLPSVPTDSALVLWWDQCVTWATVQEVVTEEQLPLMTPEEYIASIKNFIDTASIDDTLNKALLDKFHNDNPLPVRNKSTSAPWYATGVANTYAEQAFGEAAPGTCEYGCKNLSLGEQVSCELQCSKACISTCTDTSKDGQAACNANYTDDIASCSTMNSAPVATCDTNYTTALDSCNVPVDSLSTCNAHYTTAITSCDALPLLNRPACKVIAAVKKSSCIVAIGQAPTKKASCITKAFTIHTACLANSSKTFSSVKKAACKTAAVAQKAACIKQIITDQRLCVSDCTCFMIAWPNGSWWAKVEDMYRIKFCKVPVQQKNVVPRTKVYSIQAIFQEISDVLEGLRDSGQMVEFSKKKEFLDGNIKISLFDNVAFQILVGFKPLFSQKSTTTKIQEENQANVDLNQAVLGMNVSDPTSDDYNKYIVISDPVKNKANLEQYTSLSDIQSNIDKLSGSVSAYTQLSNDVVQSLSKTFAQGTKILFVQNMITFVQDNQSFWANLSRTLLDINQMSLDLKLNIEKSK